MISVTLTEAWLHDGDDLADFHRFLTVRPEYPSERDGEVRAFTNGRLRVITSAVRRRQVPLVLVDVTEDQRAWLDERIGEVVMYRDPEGVLQFCTYFAVLPRPYKSGGYEVELTLQQVSRSVEV